MNSKEINSLEPGFYYHYKHNPSLGLNHHAYEVLNIGHHTEMKGDSESAMVVYRPLSKDAYVYKMGRHWDVRPLSLFLENAIKDGQEVKRFTKILNPDLIKVLEEIRDEMYS